MGYYPIALLMMNLSKSGSVHPAWAMWLGNVLLLGAAAFVLRRVLRH
jgi:lipopolysaccharide export LptBFGC system permease protein LptF